MAKLVKMDIIKTECFPKYFLKYKYIEKGWELAVFKILSANVRNTEITSIKQNSKICVKYLKLPFQKDQKNGKFEGKIFPQLFSYEI